MKISGLKEACRVLSTQSANVVLSSAGFRRGNISLDVLPGFTGQETLFAFRKHKLSAIEKGFSDYYSGKASLLDSFNNMEIPATQEFKRVLLVAPFSGEKLAGLDRIQPQKGVERIAYYLIRNLNDTDARVYNPNLLPPADFFGKDRVGYPNIIGFGTLDPVFGETIKLMLEFKRRYPKALFVLGGIAVSHMDREKVFSALPADVIIRGFGENPMRQLVEGITPQAGRMEHQQFLSITRGDFEDVPLSRPDVLHGRSYWGKMHEQRGGSKLLLYEIGRRSLRIGTSDFCRQGCVFCSEAIVGNKEKRQSSRVELTAKEIINLMRSAIKTHPSADSFHFDDDDFLVDRDKMIALCKLMIKEKLDHYPKLCKCRIDRIDSELLSWMKKAGFKVVSYGVESFSGQVLKKMAKGISCQQIEAAINDTLDAGVVPGINLILFNPFTTVREIEEDIKKAIDYIERGAYVFVNTVMEAYHGAPIMKKKELINFQELFFEDMKSPFMAPTDVRIIDKAAAELLPKALEIKGRIIKEWEKKYNLSFVPFFISGVALFYGVYSAMRKPKTELDRLERIVERFYGEEKK